MDFELSPEQALIKDSVDRFVADEYGAEQRLASTGGEPGFSRAHWVKFAELGWLGLLAAEDDGGFGGGAVETMIVMEAFGAGLVVEPFIPAVVVAGTLLAAAGGAASAALLADAIAGERIVALAYAEPRSGYDPVSVTTTARVDGGDFIVDGQKVAVPYGCAADTIIVSARTDGAVDSTAGITLLAVDSHAPGVERRDYVTCDERRASQVSFAGVRVPRSAMVGTLGDGFPLLAESLDRGSAGVCAEAVGIMDVLVRSTVDFLKTRVQFGRPIGTFQALQHRAVDMLIQLELGRAIATHAAAAIDDGDPSARSAATAAAKAFIADAGRFVTESAIQLHGAIGITEELPISQYVKRLTAIEHEFGDAGFSLGRYMSAMEQNEAAQGGPAFG